MNSRFLVAICCCFCLCGTLLPAASLKRVEGVGMAAGTGAAARQEALSRALRNAVERAVGVMVSSESLVKNFQLLEDRIYSNVTGYVRHYEILEELEEQDVTRVKVLADVEDKRLETDLAGINILLQAKGNPRTAVVLSETLDGIPQESALAAMMVEKFLETRGFPLVDAGQMELLKERDARLDQDPAKAKVLGNRLGAELMIVGSARADQASVVQAYGVPVYAYSASLALKAIRSDTGDILATMQSTEIGHAGTPGEAAQKALHKAWESNHAEFFGRLLEKWRSEVMNTVEMTIILSGIAPDARQQLMQALGGVAGIRDLNERRFQDGVMELGVTVDGAAARALDEKIVESLPQLLLTSKSSHRLDFDLRAGNN